MLGAKNCYKVAAALLYFWELGKKEAIVSEISLAANVSVSLTRYWLNQFDCLGFIEVIRYVKRKNSICVDNRHVLIKINSGVKKLYFLTDHEKWEKEIENKKPILKLLKKVA